MTAEKFCNHPLNRRQRDIYSAANMWLRELCRDCGFIVLEVDLGAQPEIKKLVKNA